MCLNLITRRWRCLSTFNVQKYFFWIFRYCTPVYIQITRKDGLKALLVSKFCKVQPRNAFNNIVSWWLKESGRALVLLYVQSVPFENHRKWMAVIFWKIVNKRLKCRWACILWGQNWTIHTESIQFWIWKFSNVTPCSNSIEDNNINTRFAKRDFATKKRLFGK